MINAKETNAIGIPLFVIEVKRFWQKITLICTCIFEIY